MPPYVEFRIGNVPIACIVMQRTRHSNTWYFQLHIFASPEAPSVPEEFDSFGTALSHLHKMLNGQPDAGFETGVSSNAG